MEKLDPYKPELHASGFRAIIEVANDLLGQEAVADLVRSLGVSPEDLLDRDGWLSLEFAESLNEAITARANDSIWLDRAMTLGLSREHLGILHPLFRSFGTPALIYRKLTSVVPRVNKTATWSLEQLGTQYARFSVRPADNAVRERTLSMCRARVVQLSAVATLFDLPPARVEHPLCLHKGNPVCVYEVTWKEHRRPLWSMGGLTAGAILGFVLATGVGLGSALAVLSSSILAMAGWALGRTRELQFILRSRLRDLTESGEALTNSALANEKRVAELLAAKSEVELKVEERTRELKDATTKLSESFEAIQALDRAKTDFFNNVSHELRSPLTLILAPLEELVAGRVPPGGERSAFQAMRRNATRLLTLINQLLDLAKIDAGELRIVPVAADIGALLTSLVSGFDAAAKQKGVRLELHMPAAMPPLVVDPAWIESAVANLLANALRLTPAGKAIRVVTTHTGSEVTITVSDDGPGIAQEDQAKVFERFAQGENVFGGTGIGLALVREAARLHGGSVLLQSELGKGAAFTLTLPRRSEVIGTRKVSEKLPADPVAIIVDELLRETEGSERPSPTMNAPFAFVVEDNPELREFISDVLGARYRVKSFGLASHAVKEAARLRPHVIVSDVAMPEMNGFELCRALRRNQDTQSIPIVLVTARTDVGSILEGFDAGASDYVLKPFHGRELLARVDVHVRLRRMVQEVALRERHAMLGVLAASVAHQVRNPLTTLVSGLPAMRARLVGNLSPSTFELIDMMIECAGRIERLTADLMDLSHVDREARSTFRPADGLRAAVRLLNARLAPEVTLEASIEDCPPIEGRGGDMNHVFMNLLDNAIRAVESRGIVRVEALPRGRYYSVRVGDSGPGIDEDTAKQIFEPFFTTRRPGEGTGLGLAIARQVVQQCGGKIEVGRSDLGGALFSVDIPLTRSESIPLPAGSSAN